MFIFGINNILLFSFYSSVYMMTLTQHGGPAELHNRQERAHVLLRVEGLEVAAVATVVRSRAGRQRYPGAHEGNLFEKKFEKRGRTHLY